MTPFDEIAQGPIECVAPMHDGRLLVVQVHKGLRTLAVEPESGAFEILPTGKDHHPFLQADGLLLIHYQGRVWHHDGRDFSHWMGEDEGAGWSLPAEWNQRALGHRQIVSVDGKLFFLTRSADGGFVLRMFAPGGPSAGRSFPLRFENAHAENPEVIIFEPHLFATASGLLFQPHFDGVWFLPFSDLPGH